MRRIVPRMGPPREQLPEGVSPGLRMPDGPMIYLAERPELDFILLRRWYIPEGETTHARVGVPTGRYAGGFPLRTNPYGGKWGWTLHAMGPKAERERGLEARVDAASRLRYWFVRLPPESRVALQPRDRIVPNDPLRASGIKYRQWVVDDCIVPLIQSATAGAPNVAPLRFAVPPSQRLQFASGVITIQPIQELQRAFQDPQPCELETSQGISLREAATLLGYPSLHKPLSAPPDKLFERWRARAQAAGASRDQLRVNAAYHRILLHRFLQQGTQNRRLTPLLRGGGPVRREMNAAIERRANLLQAYRVFVFDRRGCPVGINVPFLEANNLKVKTVLDRKVHHAGFTAAGERARKFGAWLFTDVLDKRITECKPSNIQGLEELLAAADRLE